MRGDVSSHCAGRRNCLPAKKSLAGEEQCGLQVFLLPLLLSPSLGSYCPKSAIDGRNQPLPLDSGRRWSKLIVTGRFRVSKIATTTLQRTSTTTMEVAGDSNDSGQQRATTVTWRYCTVAGGPRTSQLADQYVSPGIAILGFT
ncbi:hypothetical protein GW17_00051537 [Ensete ventricosum]|nr:hypothetical protein GW17_00051537 [Ensete ventricosum]